MVKNDYLVLVYEDEHHIPYSCAHCGEVNEAFVDLSAGVKQQFVEGCFVCCRPNVITINVDNETGAVRIEAEYEG